MEVVLGNRGRCAQPCRLPYEVLEEKNINNKTSETIIDKGYLISPRDLCSLEYLPELINVGVKCFKIEGRLKSPEYVAIVTKIYRKYIDMFLNKKEYIIDEKDKLQLKQIFNRGEFSTGHLSNSPNRNLIFKEKPNNMGLYLGNVAGYNKLKGHIKILLNQPLSIGDTINFEKENTKYTISELMLDNLNIPNAEIGSKVIIGRMKGNIHIGDKVYKLSSKQQLLQANSSYLNENIKLPLECKISIKKDKPITMNIHLKDLHYHLYKNIDVHIASSLIPEIAKNNPISKDRIIAQVSKTNNTSFEFTKIDIDLDDGLFIPSIKELNEIRRMALSKLENIIISKNKRVIDLDETKLDKFYEKYSNSYLNKYSIEKDLNNNLKQVSIYLNTINTNYNYLKLSKKYISCVYIPLRYFMRKEYFKSLKDITSNFKTYIYMPAIIKANYKNVIKHSLEDLIKEYNIQGFIVSSLGDFVLLEKYWKKYDFIGNFTLNSFNTTSINVFKSLGLSKITLSPELNLEDITTIYNIEKEHIPLELIIYGNIPIMKMNYCVLGISNKCYPQCMMRCRTNNKYYLIDRLGFKFRILPDNVQTVTTIFNSKITSITHIDTGINSVRVDLLDETIDEINNIAKSCMNGSKLEGKQYTYGNLNREV